jgi:hypothetical protein
VIVFLSSATFAIRRVSQSVVIVDVSLWICASRLRALNPSVTGIESLACWRLNSAFRLLLDLIYCWPDHTNINGQHHVALNSFRITSITTDLKWRREEPLAWLKE